MTLNMSADNNIFKLANSARKISFLLEIVKTKLIPLILAVFKYFLLKHLILYVFFMFYISYINNYLLNYLLLTSQ